MLAAIVASSFAFAAVAHAGTLRAGVGRADITPPSTSAPSSPVAASRIEIGGKNPGNPALMRTAFAIGKSAGVHRLPSSSR